MDSDLDRVASEWRAARDVIATALREWGLVNCEAKAAAIIHRLAAHRPPILLDMQDERMVECQKT